MCFFTALSGVARAQTITRVPVIQTAAGNGTTGYSGDKGPATSAELNVPDGVAEDAVRNLYVADTGNNRIRKIAAATGVVTTIAGNGVAGYSGNQGQATSAELHSPEGIAVGAAGNLYIADTGNHVIRKVTTSGVITTVAGNGEAGYSGDNGPATSATLYLPAGVAVDGAGNLYIADAGDDRIREVNTSGIITTVAGNGTAGYSGDSGPATSAELSGPSGIAIDSTGNLYIADAGNNRVREVNTTGIITTVAGDGTAGFSGDNGAATSAELNNPSGVAIDATGNLYIADAGNNRLREVNAAAMITTVAGNGTAGFSGNGGAAASAELKSPSGVAVDAIGNLYIADTSNNRVREVNAQTGSVVFPTTQVSSTSAAQTIPLEINTDGTTITSIAAPVSQGGKQEYTVAATGCALNTSLTIGTLCNVSMTFSPAYSGWRPVPLEVVSSAGTFSFGMTGIGTAPEAALSPGIITTVPGITGSFFGLYGEIAGGLTVDSAGNAYVATNAGLLGDWVVKFAAGTGAITMVTRMGNGSSDLPLGLAIDGANNLYVANPNSYQVFAINLNSGAMTNIAGNGTQGFSGDGGPATSAELNSPSGVAVDNAGNVYIADAYNNRIRKVSAGTGIITTFAGTGTFGYSGDNGAATSAELTNPDGVAVDNAGNLYIADTVNNRIRKVSLASGIITTVAGNGDAGYSGDDGPATKAELNGPWGIVVDGAGDLYIADTGNNTLRMVNATGTITTVAGNGTIGYSGDNGPATSAELAEPQSVALDSAGNLYVGDTLNAGDQGLREVNVSSSALNYGNSPLGSTSTQTAAVTNIGNAPLTFLVPASGQNPSVSAGFTQSVDSTCPQLSIGSRPATLASGSTCSLDIGFTPTAASSATGTATIADDTLNTASEQVVQLSGTGQTVATTTTLNVMTAFLGETEISATILPTAGTAVPAGSVVFTVDGAVQPAVTLNGSGVAMLPSAISNALGLGSHTVAAVYTSSSADFSGSNATRIFTVSPIPPSITVAPSSTSLSVSPGSSVTDKLTITPAGGYAGTLQFSCTKLPQYATCSFQPSALTINSSSGAQMVVLTIQAGGGTAELRKSVPFPPTNNPIVPAAVLWAPGLLTLALSSKKRKFSFRAYRLIALLALLAGTWMMSACGGGNSPSPSPSPSPVTPAGVSTVQVAATNAGTVVQSIHVTLTVQ